MIPEQLSLFGSLKPPKKIKEDEDSPPPLPVVKEELPQEPLATLSPPEETPVEDAAIADAEIPETDSAESLPEEINAQPSENLIEAPEEPEAPLAEVLPEEEVVEEESAEPIPLVSIMLPTSSEDDKQGPVESSQAAEPLTLSEEQPAIAETRSKHLPHEFTEKAGQLNIPPDEDLFKRQYYSMRETAAMFEVSHSLLRFWENEFDILEPRKNKKGDRYFRPVDVKNLQLIYHLLRVRKFTIEGAKEFLRNRNKALDNFEMISKLEKLKSFLHELKAHL